ncbi:MAG: HD domain-containing protein, partial [Bacteroidales bacterium]
MAQKIKIINDPVHGFIQMPTGIGFDIVNHRWFQRLRNIKQLGLAYYVYPGATHTRFQHSLGAFYLTHEAIKILRTKGIDITDSEAEGVLLAILMHDIGHSPYSHTLEKVLIKGISHEQITLAFMNHLNYYTDGGLDKAIDIIKNIYAKKFLHQLVSSQLDMDRLDYLKRDSFFTGVLEGVIGTERIIKMLTVSNDSLAIEEKGIYSIEKFLIARRLMYWQVYLHKTVLAAEL